MILKRNRQFLRQRCNICSVKAGISRSCLEFLSDLCNPRDMADEEDNQRFDTDRIRVTEGECNEPSPFASIRNGSSEIIGTKAPAQGRFSHRQANQAIPRQAAARRVSVRYRKRLNWSAIEPIYRACTSPLGTACRPKRSAGFTSISNGRVKRERWSRARGSGSTNTPKSGGGITSPGETTAA